MKKLILIMEKNSDIINDMVILSRFYFVFSLEFNKFVKIVKLNIFLS